MTFRAEERLLTVITDLKSQAASLGSNIELDDIEDLVISHGEYGEAYELTVCLLESSAFTLSSKSAVALLEVGLAFGYKTGREQDDAFDRRSVSAVPGNS